MTAMKVNPLAGKPAVQDERGTGEGGVVSDIQEVTQHLVEHFPAYGDEPE
ncbi:MAG: hypothetical protein IT488_12300 [Gammaproteobacteria bacterium]|nr:hypothetical protein [Gammaproteobacteria bacterium]